MVRQISTHIAPARKPKEIKGDISVVIMAANMGYRMKSYGPQCLLKINGYTLLQHQINLIQKAFSNVEIVLVVGFCADKIIKNKPPNIRIVENQLYETTNELEQARLALNNICNDNVLIINSDIFFNAGTLESINTKTSCLLYSSQKTLPENEVGVTVVDGKATIFSFGIDTKWTQIVYLTGKELKAFKTVCSNREKSKLYLFEGLNDVLHRSPLLAIEPSNMHITKVDNTTNMETLK